MFQTFDDAQEFVTQSGAQMIDLKFCDLWGRWRHVTIPASQFKPTLMTQGIGFDGSSVGLKSVKSGDMVLIPRSGHRRHGPVLGCADPQPYLQYPRGWHSGGLSQRPAQHRPPRPRLRSPS